MILLHFCVCFCIATAHPIRNTLPLFSNRKCKSKTDKNTLVAANAWGNCRSDLSWDKEALPDRRVSIGQKPSFQFGRCDRQGSNTRCSRQGVSQLKSLSERVTPGICLCASTTPSTNSIQKSTTFNKVVLLRLSRHTTI